MLGAALQPSDLLEMCAKKYTSLYFMISLIKKNIQTNATIIMSYNEDTMILSCNEDTMIVSCNTDTIK